MLGAEYPGADLQQAGVVVAGGGRVTGFPGPAGQRGPRDQSGGVFGAADPLLGDYWRYKFDTAGVTNFTNFYLAQDPMNTGWSGTSPTNAAANGGVAPANTTGLLTAWCISCHTRYNGYSTAGTTSTPITDDAGLSSPSGSSATPSQQTPTQQPSFQPHTRSGGS